jgi:hypothetical protein
MAKRKEINVVENRQKVADAISSGMYKKCQGALYDGMDGNQKQMCIWGVVSDVYMRETGNKARIEGGMPEARVVRWVGLDLDCMDTLITKNDETNKHLKTLAKEMLGMPVIKNGE